VFRLFVGISTFIAAAAIVAATAGVAAADPDPSGNGSEPDPGVEAPSPSEPQPTTGTTTQPTPPSIFDIPQTIANQLRDMFGRPLSVFGNGRVPGTHTEPDGTAQDPGTVTGRKHDRPTAKKAEPPPPDVAEPEAPAPKPRGSVNVVLPFVPSLSVPIPPSPVAGSRDVHLTLDLTDPVKALASVQNTLNTVNSLLADAYAPYDPTRPPAPKPATTFRTLQEEPDVVDADGAGAPEALATGSSRLPVLQVPVLAPQARIDVPRPVTGMSPGGAQAPQAAGSPPVEAPAPRPGAPARLPASAPRPAPSGPPGSAAEPPPPRGSASALVNSAPREGYPQYLRSARLTQVATVALPGLGGLVALTASGGVIGYRQANSGRYLRSDAARFLQ
jgi:hypothetical protein